MGGGGGLGNLADELADALSEEDDDYYDQEDGVPGVNYDIEDGQGVDGIRDSGVDVASSSSGHGPGIHQHRGSLSIPSPNGKGHRRQVSDYDGSEYGSESDFESPGIPPRLAEKIDEVEALARRGTENNGSSTDGVFQRLTEGLRDLSSQSGVEGGATRLITAHSALSTHLSHQTRQLHALTFPLLSPLATPPDPDEVDELLPMLVTLAESMPRPSAQAFQSIASLHALTTDIVQTLNYLSDTLHMSRQTTTTAARRLRSAKELVSELRREEELREEGERWLTRGGWSEKLKRRECAHVCGEVVGGFEEVCNGFRERLLAQDETSAAQV